MDEDDEFGDLYTDVLIPFTTSNPSILSSSSTPPPPPPPNPDLNPNPKIENPQTLQTPPSQPINSLRVLEDTKIEQEPHKDENFAKPPDKDTAFTTPEVEIPGISGTNYIPDDDWDSDSEDDLQIVLNEKSAPVGIDNRHGVLASDDDDDEDGEDLVIVADDQHHQQHQHQGMMDDQDWGDDSLQIGDGGERKDGADGLKVNGGVVNNAGNRIGGYNSHLYPSHHSQFKYVRPGAPVVPGGAIIGPGGAPGQVRPVVNMGLAFGRGRGDWRPMGPKTAPGMQKPFHSGFGSTAWGNNSSGRGSGLEFTLPSHKTVFDVDIDSFEDKPWRTPGIDLSDFFNFGLDEENWKDYCKQLEQLRLEATMQSRIRVYESGRSEQNYDPDLPPELAIAAGIHDASAENPNFTKQDGSLAALDGQGRGAARPAILPTGRAIQVEGGFGERLPSIDTRPPRLRDSDAIIEIVLHGSTDDDPMTANDSSNDVHRDESRGGENEEDIGPNDYFDPLPQPYNGRKREMVGKKDPFRGSGNNIHERDGSFPSEVPVQSMPSSKGRASNYSGGTPQDGRWPQGTRQDRYSHQSSERGNDVIPCESALVSKPSDSERERSGESNNGEQNLEATSSADADVARERSIEQKVDLENDIEVDHSSIALEGQETLKDVVVSSDTVRDGSPLPSYKRQKLSSRVEQPTLQETGSLDGLRATRSSDNSKARSASSREYQKRRDDGEEVVQEGRSRRAEELKRRRVEDDYNFQRKDEHIRDGRLEMDRGRVLAKGREDSRISYPYRDWDLHQTHLSRVKPGEMERSRERDSSVGARQRRDSDAHGRRLKDEDIRQKEHIEEVGYRHRSKLRESEKIEKDEHLHSRKRVDNGDWRGPHDRDVGPRQREKDDSLMMRHENMDESHSRRRKEEGNLKKEQADKDILHGYKAREDVSRRKRVRDDVLDQRKREEQPRVRERPDDNHSARHREDGWRERDKDERRLKQPHEDIFSIRDREGRNSIRSGRDLEDKSWVGNTRLKGDSKGLGSDKDYPYKDKRKTSEHSKRNDRAEDELFTQHKGRDNVYARENQFTSEDRNPRHERSSTYNERLMNVSDSQFMQKERHRDSGRSKESDRTDQNTLGSSKRKPEDNNGHRSEKVSGKGASEQESGITGHTSSRDPGHSRLPSALSKKNSHEHDMPQQRHSSRKHREDAVSDDEQQNLRRGRSKLERWTSNKDRDDIANSLSTSKAKEPIRNTIDLYSEASEQPDDQVTTVGSVEDQNQEGEEKLAHDLEVKESPTESIPVSGQAESEKAGDERHLDTVAKLKKRSERFKTPMPSEKDVTTCKKVESEVLVPAQCEVADAEVKAERPARKRRWTGST